MSSSSRSSPYDEADRVIEAVAAAKGDDVAATLRAGLDQIAERDGFGPAEYMREAARCAEQLYGVVVNGSQAPEVTPATAGMPASQAPAAEPEPRAAASTEPNWRKLRPSTTEKTPVKRPRPPSDLPDPGLTAVTDSGLPKLIGRNAAAVWLCLLRHANGRDARRVKKIGYDQISEGTGLTRWQVRDGIKNLLGFDIIERPQTGRSDDGAKLTAEYVVPFPTPTRIERWLVKATGKETT